MEDPKNTPNFFVFSRMSPRSVYHLHVIDTITRTKIVIHGSTQIGIDSPYPEGHLRRHDRRNTEGSRTVSDTSVNDVVLLVTGVLVSSELRGRSGSESGRVGTWIGSGLRRVGPGRGLREGGFESVWGPGLPTQSCEPGGSGLSGPLI